MKIIPTFLKRMLLRNLAIANQYLVQTGQPIYTNWTLSKAVKEGYKINSWVYRSVYLISKAGAQVSWRVINKKDGSPLPDHHLSKLFKKPNPYISKQDMFELVISWLELAGNSYLKKVKVGKETKELWPISPDRLAPVPAKKIDEWIAGYALDQSQKVNYTPDEIIHHKFFNPANPLIGIAPLQAAARTVDIDNEQQNWNKSTMQNRGIPSGVMSFKRDFQNQDEVDKISERLNESDAGSKNAKKIKVVGSDAKYTQMSLTPVEMDFSKSRGDNMNEIFITFGIPPAYGGSQDSSTYNNFETSELIFWFQTEIPLLDDLKDTFNLSFKDELGENEIISYDLSSVAAIKKAMVKWVETSTKLHEMGVPFEQLNKIFNFGFEKFEGWEKSYVKTQKAQEVVEKRESKVKDNKIKYTLIEKRAIFDEKKEIAELAEGDIKDIVFDLLDKQREDIFKNLTEANVKSVIKKSSSEWVDTFEKIYIDVGVEFGSNLVIEKRAIGDELETELLDFLDSEGIVLSEVTLMGETTRDKVLEWIEEGLELGYTDIQIQQAIIDTGVFSPERALAIARTETGTAANLGQKTAAIISGADKKTWSTATFEVRETHQAVNNITVDIDKKFTVGGELADYPMDPNLSAKERVN